MKNVYCVSSSEKKIFKYIIIIKNHTYFIARKIIIFLHFSWIFKMKKLECIFIQYIFENFQAQNVERAADTNKQIKKADRVLNLYKINHIISPWFPMQRWLKALGGLSKSKWAMGRLLTDDIHETFLLSSRDGSAYFLTFKLIQRNFRATRQEGGEKKENVYHSAATITYFFPACLSDFPSLSSL